MQAFRPLSLSTAAPAGVDSTRLSVETPIIGATHGTGVGIGGVVGRAHSSPALSVFTPPPPDGSMVPGIDIDALAVRTASDVAPATARGLQKVPTSFVPHSSQYYLSRCVPNEKRVRFSFFMFVGTTLLLGLLVAIYVSGMVRIRAWINSKRKLKTSVKQLALHTADVVALAATTPISPVSTARPDRADAAIETPAMGRHPSADPRVTAWLAELDGVRLGVERRGFVFVLDGDGGVWAHSKARHLVGDARGMRSPGFHSVRDVDDARGDQPMARIMRAAKKGGGYVHFLWKKERLMVAFACPVRGTDLVLGGAIPVPRTQTLWEQQYAVAAEKRASAKRPVGMLSHE